MADDQVGSEVGVGLAGLVDPVGVPGGVLEGAAAVVGGLPRASGRAIPDLADAVDLTGRGLRDAAAPPAAGTDQVAGDVAELGREVLVNEQILCERPVSGL
jgi:hypothetical protein